jgi:hypothetical protein
MKNWAKILQNLQKRKMIHTTWRRDPCTKIGYIERIKHLQGVETTITRRPLFGGLEGSLTFSPLLSYTMKHTNTSQKATIAWERDGRMLISPPTLGVLFIVKTED